MVIPKEEDQTIAIIKQFLEIQTEIEQEPVIMALGLMELKREVFTDQKYI